MKLLLTILIFISSSTVATNTAYKRIVANTIEYVDKAPSLLVTEFIFFPDSVQVMYHLPMGNRGEWLIREKDYYRRTANNTIVTIREGKEIHANLAGEKVVRHYLYIFTQGHPTEVKFHIIFLIERSIDGKPIVRINEIKK